MFTQTSADVRAFFALARRKRGAGAVLSPIETIAADWIDAHPEYAADLDNAGATAVASSGDRENPFLHLSMHLTISEQLQIDQPRGIRAAYERLAARRHSAHAAHHEVMECLGEMLWRSQRDATAPDGEAYVACVQRRAG